MNVLLVCNNLTLSLAVRLAITPLGKDKPKKFKHSNTTCLLIVRKIFIAHLTTTKSKELNWDLVRGQASKPYSKIGIHITFNK